MPCPTHLPVAGIARRESAPSIAAEPGTHPTRWRRTGRALVYGCPTTQTQSVPGTKPDCGKRVQMIRGRCRVRLAGWPEIPPTNFAPAVLVLAPPRFPPLRAAAWVCGTGNSRRWVCDRHPQLGRQANNSPGKIEKVVREKWVHRKPASRVRVIPIYKTARTVVGEPRPYLKPRRAFSRVGAVCSNRKPAVPVESCAPV